MFKKIVVILLIITPILTKAQSEIPKSLNISLGFASTYPYDDDINISGQGFIFQGEYIISPKKYFWFLIRILLDNRLFL